MSPVPNPRIVFAKIPGAGYPVVGEHLVYESSREIDIENVALKGGFLTKMLILSPEPYMRERMRDRSVPSYSTPFKVGEPVMGACLLVVVRSEKEGVKAGDLYFGMSPWEAYTVQPYVEGRWDFKREEWPPYTYNMDDFGIMPVPHPNGAFPLTNIPNVLGIPGTTAFTAFEKYAEAKEGDTIFVSSGASGVGSLVVQLAKAKGLKVIASAGSEAKLDYMRSIGADKVFNYKQVSYVDALKEYGPINIFWDNVGGEAFDAALQAAGLHSRFIICGSISEYNIPFEKRHPLRNADIIWKKRINVRGILVTDDLPEFMGRFFTEMPALLAQGKIKAQEKVLEGWEIAAQALVDTFKDGGETIGKPVVIVAKP